jgi:hypothetical protein
MKIFTIVVALLICTQTQAQIPNAGFEDWTNWSGWFDDPDNWDTNNGQLFTPVVKDTFAYQGDFAMQVNFNGSAATIFPVASHPQILSAFVKTNFTSYDTVGITIRVYANDLVTDSAVWLSTTPQTSWTQIDIPVSQNNPNADSVEIIVSGGNQPNTTFSIDDVSFLITGFGDIISNPINIFPNPVNDQLFVNLPGNRSPKTVKIFNINLQGIKIINQVSKTGQSTICVNVNDLVAGTYLFSVECEDKSYNCLFIK